MWTSVSPSGGGPIEGVVLPSVLVACVAASATTPSLLESVEVVATAVVVSPVVVLVAASAGVLEALSAMRVVDVEASRSGGVVVASAEESGEDVQSTSPEASPI